MRFFLPLETSALFFSFFLTSTIIKILNVEISFRLRIYLCVLFIYLRFSFSAHSQYIDIVPVLRKSEDFKVVIRKIITKYFHKQIY